eukprot:1157492-Pelagomonas_calceolata.AAC.11
MDNRCSMCRSKKQAPPVTDKWVQRPGLATFTGVLCTTPSSICRHMKSVECMFHMRSGLLVQRCLRNSGHHTRQNTNT